LDILGRRRAAAFSHIDGFGKLIAGCGAIVGWHTLESDVRNAGTKTDNTSQNEYFANHKLHGIPSPCAENLPASPNRRRICDSASL
jgi:hypothetical protein